MGKGRGFMESHHGASSASEGLGMQRLDEAPKAIALNLRNAPRVHMWGCFGAGVATVSLQKTQRHMHFHISRATDSDFSVQKCSYAPSREQALAGSQWFW